MDQLSDKIKTYARALGGPCVLIPQSEESLKDALAVCQRDSRTIISYGNDHFSVVSEKLDVDLAAYGIFERILYEIDNDAAHGITVAAHDNAIVHIHNENTCIQLTLKMGLTDSANKAGEVGLLQVHGETTGLHTVHQQQILDQSLKSVRIGKCAVIDLLAFLFGQFSACKGL